MMPHSNRVNFLDGIRGISVVFVVLYHFYPDVFPGGYSGVDIFFMLSGYLITKSIIKNYEKGEGYGLLDFYSSRITRIFPILLVVTLSVYIVGWFLLEPWEYNLLAQHAVYSIAQVLNFVLWSEDGYFNVASNFKVFLHMWSLSVEWQIYLTAPLIILLIVRISGFVGKAGIIVLAGSIIGMSAFIYAATYHPVGAYYFTPLRSWAFFFGSSLYLLEGYRAQSVNLQRNVKYDLNIINLNPIYFLLVPVVLAANVLLLPKYLNYSYVNIISVLTISILIVSKPKFPESDLLRVTGQILVWLGVISFSIYLWHWPILSFTRILGWGGSSLISLTGVIVTLFISVFTYRYIEKPLNESKNKKSVAVKILMLAILLCVICLPVIMSNGAPNRYFSLVNSDSARARASEAPSLFPAQQCDNVSGVIDSWCNTTKYPRVLLLGDSHANLLMRPLIESRHKVFSEVYNIGAGNCHPSIGVESREGCNRQINATLKRLANMPNIEYAIITSWNIPTKNHLEDYFLGYSKLFDTLLKSGVKPVFIVDNPTLNKSPRSCRALLSNISLRKVLSKPDSICFNVTAANFIPNKTYAELVSLLKRKYTNVHFINPFDSVCPNLTCSIIQKGQLLYSDEGHLSYSASKIIVQHTLEEIHSSGF